MPFDFANILFAGPCNLRCPYCIGRQVEPALNRNNLADFPLANLDHFVSLLQQHQVTEVVLTGTTTDPQLYRHEARLLAWLRERLPPGVHYSLHTNGRLALRQMDTFNLYDRVSLSFPSFRPATYAALTGSTRVPELAEIVRQARVPLKISCVLTDRNAAEVEEILTGCAALGLKRLVFRPLFGDRRDWRPLFDHLPQLSTYRNNPVFGYHGLEVTLWSFHQTSATSLNLFSDGTISTTYLLTQAENIIPATFFSKNRKDN
jgi:pyruvate-formate lyase-activating enzyme